MLQHVLTPRYTYKDGVTALHLIGKYGNTEAWTLGMARFIAWDRAQNHQLQGPSKTPRKNW
eukprot:986809-Amphidinium_carterae.1